MLKTAYQISNVIISTCTINTASERAGKVVFALKHYARYNATGEKLDIVKKIIDKHRGKIEVESMPGQTTFMVFLPIALADRAGI